MKITQIKKRNGDLQEFVEEKISTAIEKAMQAVAHGSSTDAKEVAATVTLKLRARCTEYANNNSREDCEGYTPGVEEIQDLVEESLMSSDFHDVAKAYILYRNKQAQERKRDIFAKRVHIKPAEYPELLAYVDAIRHSYWIHTEFNFTSDIQDFKVRVNKAERTAITNAMLAIAQIEVAVKTFWGDIYKKMPKPEIGSVGYTFAESEVRHQDAYAHLLEILGLNDTFKKVKEIPVIAERILYLEKSIEHAKSDDNREYAESVLLFSLFIEHVSLFSQFLIIMAFNKHKNLFKGISNAIEATSKEEQIHGLFGIEIIGIIKSEHPEWFTQAYHAHIVEACTRAYDAEEKIIEWIFEDGELDFLPKAVVLEFIKNRFNNSLESIGVPRIFSVDESLLTQTEWFDDEVIGTKHGDFFVKRSTNYNKRSQSITSDDLF